MKILRIHDEYYDRIKRFVTSVLKDSYDTDDVVQETFIRADRHIDSLRDPSRVLPWLYRIASNLCMDHLKKSKPHSESGDIESCPDDSGTHRSLEQSEMTACIRKKIDMLPESLRIPLILFDIEDLSHAEISEILGISIDNTRVRLHRARAKLKTILEKECCFERDERDVLVCVPASEAER